MIKLSFYVPASDVEKVKEAVFDAGAGRVGDYDCCAWQCLGQGQFRALEGSDPFVGQQNQMTKVDEYKVELVCGDDSIDAVVSALKAAHPYEEPAYSAVKVLDI